LSGEMGRVRRERQQHVENGPRSEPNEHLRPQPKRASANPKKMSKRRAAVSETEPAPGVKKRRNRVTRPEQQSGRGTPQTVHGSKPEGNESSGPRSELEEPLKH
jgi:hypothetical protein